jgi:hypothetical protein
LAKLSNNTAGNLDSYSKSGNSNSLHKQIFDVLDNDGNTYPLLTPKQICKLLDLSYQKYHNYVSKTKWEWKYYSRNERGSKCSSLHCFKAKVRLDLVLSQGLRGVVASDGELGVLGFGWVRSKSKNRFWMWPSRLGRVVWFESGTVTLHVRRPGNLGKAKQLFCDAFVNTGLLSDMKLLNPVLERIRPKSGHFPYSAGEQLPYMVIRDFELSHGIVIKVGDRTHPDAIEVIASFSETMDGALDKLERLEKNELKNGEALLKITGILSNLFGVDSDKRAAKGCGGKDYVS